MKVNARTIRMRNWLLMVSIFVGLAAICFSIWSTDYKQPVADEMSYQAAAANQRGLSNPVSLADAGRKDGKDAEVSAENGALVSSKKIPSTRERVERLAALLDSGDASAAAKISHELLSCSVVLGLDEDVPGSPGHWASRRFDECVDLADSNLPSIQDVLKQGAALGSLEAMVSLYYFPPGVARANPEGSEATKWAEATLARIGDRAASGDLDASFEYGRLAMFEKYGFSDQMRAARMLEGFLLAAPNDPRSTAARRLLITGCGAVNREDWSTQCLP